MRAEDEAATETDRAHEARDDQILLRRPEDVLVDLLVRVVDHGNAQVSVLTDQVGRVEGPVPGAGAEGE